MTLEIIGFARSNFVRTVRMVAEEKGVAYEHLPEMPHSDVINALHPLGQIPAMRHDGFELIESMAIAQYIDAVFDGPAMIPSEIKECAKVLQWSSFVQTSVDRLILRQYVVQYLFNKDADGNVVRTEIDQAVKRFPKMFSVLDKATEGGFLAGNSFSMADCFLMPILGGARLFPESKEAFDASPALTAYFEAHSQRPSFVGTALQPS
jgi:glutathione S-transferase